MAIHTTTLIKNFNTFVKLYSEAINFDQYVSSGTTGNLDWDDKLNEGLFDPNKESASFSKKLKILQRTVLKNLSKRSSIPACALSLNEIKMQVSEVDCERVSRLDLKKLQSVQLLLQASKTNERKPRRNLKRLPKRPIGLPSKQKYVLKPNEPFWMVPVLPNSLIDLATELEKRPEGLSAYEWKETLKKNRDISEILRNAKKTRWSSWIKKHIEHKMHGLYRLKSP